MYRGLVEGPLGDRHPFLVMAQPDRIVTCCVGPRGLRVLTGARAGGRDEAAVEYEWMWGVWLCGEELTRARLARDASV